MIIPPTLRMKMSAPPMIWTAAMMMRDPAPELQVGEDEPVLERSSSFCASAVMPQIRFSAPAMTR